jgi:PKHD-type hydroxylase
MMNDYIGTFENFLSIEECNTILNKCKEELTLSAAKVYNNSRGEHNKTNRKSSVAWISDLGFLNERLTNKLRGSFNIKGMEVTGLGEYQFTEYKEGEYFDWHTDSNKTIFKDRFVSIVIQLNNSYAGGILQIRNSKGEDLSIENKIGTLYIFSSNLLHRVTPVNNGVRYSLVNWISLIKTNSDKKNLI